MSKEARTGPVSEQERMTEAARAWLTKALPPNSDFKVRCIWAGGKDGRIALEFDVWIRCSDDQASAESTLSFRDAIGSAMGELAEKWPVLLARAIAAGPIEPTVTPSPVD